jgi:hypothetical protein
MRAAVERCAWGRGAGGGRRICVAAVDLLLLRRGSLTVGSASGGLSRMEVQ